MTSVTVEWKSPTLPSSALPGSMKGSGDRQGAQLARGADYTLRALSGLVGSSVHLGRGHSVWFTGEWSFQMLPCQAQSDCG